MDMKLKVIQLLNKRIPSRSMVKLLNLVKNHSTSSKNNSMNNKPICIIDDRGTKKWYLNDQLHREDGPAVEYADGHMVFYLNGKSYYYREWLKLIPNPLKYAWIKFNEQQTNL